MTCRASCLAYTIKLNLIMGNMVQESGKVAGRDEEEPTAIFDDFRAILEDMKALQEMTFLLCIQPPEVKGRTVGQPMLLVFGDGSRSQLCPTLCMLATIG